MSLPRQKFSWPTRNASAEEILRWGIDEFGKGLAISTSFQATGSVILDMAACMTGGDINVFSLDTGRLPEETYDQIDRVRRRYGIEVELLSPDSAELNSMLTRHGPNLFYNSVPQRKLCCEIRKSRPLKRRLVGFDAWVVGLRRRQNSSREHLEKVAIDEEHGGIIKLAPLADWTHDQVFDYIKRNDVPMHPLYDLGYPSIGCQPCSRPIKPGETERAGRWWWEADADKECGMHLSSQGELRREIDILLDEVLPVRRPYRVKQGS